MTASSIINRAPFSRSVITTTAVAVLVLVAMPQRSEAKGPESVTVSGPGIVDEMEIIDAGNADQRGRLFELSGVWFGTGDLPTPLGREPTTELGPAYSVTWIAVGPPGAPVADRTIRQSFYPFAEDGPVIHTQEVPEGWGQEVGGWFAASPELTEILLAMGVPLADPAGGGSGWMAPFGAILVAVLALLAWQRRQRPGLVEAIQGARVPQAD